MNKKILIGIIAAIAFTVPVALWNILPLFTNSVVDEPLPTIGKVVRNHEQDTRDDILIDANPIRIYYVAAGSIMSDTTANDKNNNIHRISLGSNQSNSDTKTKDLSGIFVGPSDGIHNAEGTVKVVALDDRSKFLRLEKLKVTNGPDLYVYLATDKTASDFVDLGRLKGNIGNQNYNIPPDTDLSKYNTVLIWCKTFSVLFGTASLS